MLGISVYFQDLDLEYLKKAKECGAYYVFSSLHIPEEDYSTLGEKLPLFFKTVDELGLEVVPDISPNTFAKLNLEPGDYDGFKKLGFKALRLDYGFDDFEVVKTLLKDYKIMLNASVVDGEYLRKAKEAGVDFTNLALTHNFYPRNETALSMEVFDKRNAEFAEFDIPVQAFIPGDDLKRFPLYEGLPTVEKHRGKNPYVSAVELMKKCGIKDVLIGDSKAKIETLKFINDYMEHNVMHIKVFLEEEYTYLYNQELKSRADSSENVIRITTERKPGVKVFQNVDRPRGSITMDNHLIGRYGGEVQLLKKDFPMDARVNVIGHIHPAYVDLLEYIDRDTVIKFVPL